MHSVYLHLIVSTFFTLSFIEWSKSTLRFPFCVAQKHSAFMNVILNLKPAVITICHTRSELSKSLSNDLSSYLDLFIPTRLKKNFSLFLIVKYNVFQFSLKFHGDWTSHQMCPCQKKILSNCIERLDNSPALGWIIFQLNA